MNIFKALSREEANKLTKQKPAKPDKRNLALSKEGLIMPNSEAFSILNKEDIVKRTRAAKVKKEKLKNPNIFLSKTRISIRNIPKSLENKQLKKICREFVEKEFPDAKN